MRASSKQRARQKGPKPESVDKYREALQLYMTTELSCREICDLCGVGRYGFSAYVRKHYREALLSRNGVASGSNEAVEIRLQEKFGQSPAACTKYGKAIEACKDTARLEYNVSQIAHMFNLRATALANQLRAHFPEIPVNRERERMLRGLSDNQQRGVRPQCALKYAGAVQMLRESDCTLRQAAEAFSVPFGGLKQHLLFYHRDLVEKRRKKREAGRGTVMPGNLNGSGRPHSPTPATLETYRQAVELYRTTALTTTEIAERTGVSQSGLRSHLRTWHRELILERRGCTQMGQAWDIPLSATKRYLKSTAQKYAPAIKRLKEGGLSTAAVAAEFGLNPETFRKYLHEHEPELSATLGMTRLENGRTTLRRSTEKYAEAVRLYETTTGPLSSIARRLGLQYNSVGGFVRRNCPETIARHNALCAAEGAARTAMDGATTTRQAGKV